MKSSETESTRIPAAWPEHPLRFFLLRLLLTAGIGVVLLLLAAAADYMTEDPNRFAVPLALVALYTASLAGGILFSPSPLPFYLNGLIGGSAFLLLLTAISCALPKTASMHFKPALSVLLHLAVVLCFLAGSFFGRLYASGARQKRRRKRRA